MEKGLRKLGEFLGKLGEGFLRVFRFFWRRRDFRDGGDGEADWPAGPQRARDSRRGGRPRFWGDTRWATARAQAVPAGFAARAPKEENRPGFRKGGKMSLAGKF
jgi:hypothetical protein